MQYYNITLMLNRATETRRLHTSTHALAVRQVIEQFRHRHADIYAWVIMPDHIHMLFGREKPINDLDKFVGRIKRWINKAMEARGLHTLNWRDHYQRYDVDVSTLEHAREHILRNPERGALVKDYRTYEWHGSPDALPQG